VPDLSEFCSQDQVGAVRPELDRSSVCWRRDLAGVAGVSLLRACGGHDRQASGLVL
jgi:hypothetical protein